MATPVLQIEKRVDNLEKAVDALTDLLVQAQTGFNSTDAARIKRILEEGEPSKGGLKT